MTDLPEARDLKGELLGPGRRVAYNISGCIAEGVVVSVDVKQRSGRWKWAIKIELQHPAAGHSRGHISTIRSPHNAMAIR